MRNELQTGAAFLRNRVKKWRDRFGTFHGHSCRLLFPLKACNPCAICHLTRNTRFSSRKNEGIKFREVLHKKAVSRVGAANGR